LIPESTWRKLALPTWEQPEEWSIFQEFSEAYGNLYQHVEHLADITRIESIASNPVGEKIAKNHLKTQQKQAEPYLQKTFDALEAIASNISAITDETIHLRPNINDCFELVCELQDAVVPPVDETQGTYALAGNEINAWRDQLKDGLNALGVARYLWITDFLGEDCAIET